MRDGASGNPRPCPAALDGVPERMMHPLYSLSSRFLPVTCICGERQIVSCIRQQQGNWVPAKWWPNDGHAESKRLLGFIAPCKIWRCWITEAYGCASHSCLIGMRPQGIRCPMTIATVESGDKYGTAFPGASHLHFCHNKLGTTGYANPLESGHRRL